MHKHDEKQIATKEHNHDEREAPAAEVIPPKGLVPILVIAAEAPSKEWVERCKSGSHSHQR